ncbi:FAD-dependent oxidoreductase [Dokdonia sp. Dokd-P16]|uniref:NAD(P)/FAD-dependent oxidoreductase n=1 Tax=Dokdonia sp. Dokd-P16 TaxID=2173169 RepID=UPI000D546D03|nr:FAD-dependent oxidoreductase [Dokdonia sp. Dokd-P16]AWH73400.1 FAD-dependent oxidoreductase [Dokdonia sp. Dokd-P16]
MNLSFWERESWFNNLDYTIVGSGIVGLLCAIRLREKDANSKIVILEKGLLPNGASTKNAGFACFGSISELLEDLKTHSEEEMVSLVKQRVEGLKLLRSMLGDQEIDYQEHGGYELFTSNDKVLYEECVDNLSRINKLLFPVFNKDVYTLQDDAFGFDGIENKVIFNNCEGQIDTGMMMSALLKLAHAKGILILNGMTVNSYREGAESVKVVTAHNAFITKKLFIATNGFASALGLSEVKPARAQVLITHPIPELKVKGTFHLDKGYYYFRNINDRILLGGGRNLDMQGEETMEMSQTVLIQNELERLLAEVILPNTPYTIDHRWSGIMGVGVQKKPVVKKLSKHTYCGVRLGGMGVAIGSTIGKNLADLI